jgi:arylsulfatase A-like enzyme
MRFAHALLALALAPLAVSCGKAPTGKYNVVLISIDSLRADRIGPYGHKPEFATEVAVTPNLDRLAASGVTFEDAWTTSSWTLPAHVALMTALNDRAHQVEHDDFMVDPLRATLPEAFQNDGYATGGAFSGPFLDPRYGFGRGFDEYRSGMTTPAEFAAMVKQEDAKRRAQKRPPLQPRDVATMRDRLSHWDLTSPRVNAFAREFLADHGDGRFFLFLHYFDAHYDYLPDRGDPELPARFDPGYRGDYHGENWYFDAERVMSWPSQEQPWAERRIGERDLQHALALYDAEIHWVDRHVGEVLDLIAAAGLEDETIVIVLSDHGDEFFDHGSIGHRSTLHSELLHVPLIVRVPGTGQSGQRVPALARITDVAPSLLDWCGLPPLPDAQGASLRALIETGQSDGRTALHRIYAGFNRDRVGPPNVREAWRDEEFAVVRSLIPTGATEDGMSFAPWKDPRTGRDFLVYDRVADPREFRPLATEDPRYALAIERFRAAWRANEAAVTNMRHSPVTMRRSEEQSADQKAATAALGYVDAAGAGSGQRQPPLLPFPEPQLPR